MKLLGKNIPNIGNLVAQTFRSSVSIILLLAAFTGVQSSMSVMAQATSDQSLVTNDKDRSIRFQENNYDKETTKYIPKVDPTGITDASKEFNKNVSNAISSLPTITSNLSKDLASSVSHSLGELLSDKTKTTLQEGKTLEIGEIKAIVEKETQIQSGDGKNLLSKDVLLQDLKKEETKTTFEFGNPDQHLLFNKAVKMEIKTTEQELDIQVLHEGQTTPTAEGLSNNGTDFKTEKDKVLTIKSNNNTAIFWTKGASSFVVTPSSGTIRIITPVNGSTVSPNVQVTGTGSVNGATATLTLSPANVILGTATVTGGIWSISPTEVFTTGSHTICVNETADCTTFTVNKVLNVTINQGVEQVDPVGIGSFVKFTATFNQAIDITSFTAADITLTGTSSGKSVTSVTQIAPNNGTTFEILVTATSEGTITVSIPIAITGYGSSILGTTANSPTSIAVDSTGNVYTVNQSAGNVPKITSTGVSSILGTTGSSPIGITIDSAGNIYTANSTSANVSKITPDGVSTIFGSTDPGPRAITIDSAGNIYTANLGPNNITKITPEGVSTTFGTIGSTSYQIITDPAGNIYTPNFSSNDVTKTTPSGVSTILGTTGMNPYEITIDSVGNIYTTNYISNDITKITPAGISTIFATTGTNPIGITIDSANNLYVVNSTSANVSKITPDGVSTIIGTTGINPYGISMDPVGNLYISNNISADVTKIEITLTTGIKTVSGSFNNVSTSTDNTVTLLAPAAPTITTPSLTKDSTPVITGICENGTVVYITILPTGETQSIQCAAGIYSVTPLTNIPDGQYTVNAISVDSQNNTSSLVSAIGIVDTTVPTPAVITGPATPVQLTTPLLTGTGTPGDTINVNNAAGITICTTTVQQNGTWSCTPTIQLVEGSNSLVPETCDPAGNCVFGTVFNVSLVLNLKLAIKAFLSGSYDASTHLMRTKLRSLNIISTNQPYSHSPWNYTGTETAFNMPSDIVDWILVEIKNTSGVIVQKKAALIKSNGMIIEADGSNPTGLNLNGTITPGNYKIILRHRNHLAVASDIPVNLILGTNPLDFTTFDFSTNVNVTYGNQSILEGGIYGMRKANVNGTNATNSQDRTIMKQATESTSIYSKYDLNLDGVYNSLDRVISRLEPDAVETL